MGAKALTSVEIFLVHNEKYPEPHKLYAHELQPFTDRCFICMDIR